MKKKIVLFALIFTALVSLFYLVDTTYLSEQIIDGKNIIFTDQFYSGGYYTKTSLVPVSKFKNTKTNYSLKELEEAGLVTFKANEKMVPTGLDYKLISEKELVTKLDSGSIALLTPEEVTSKYKTVFVEGQNYWDKDFEINKYPLSVSMLKPFTKLKDNNTKTTIFSSGEIIPARAVDRIGLNINNNYTYLFDFFKDEIENADLSIAMLENSLLGDPDPCTGCTTFRSDDRVAQGLADVGYDLVSTAGNHAGDAGQDAYANTIKLFKEAGVKITGTGKNDKETLIPAISEVNDMRIGLLAADDIAYFYWGKITEDGIYGTNSFSSIVNNSTVIDQERVGKIKEIKEEYAIDYLIVYMSWGVEYTNKPTIHQQELGKILIDNGVDLVIASHPHWVQSVEFYKNKPIIYSLGNFIFDQTHELETRQGATVNLHFYDNVLKSIEFMPVQTCGYHQTLNNVTDKYLNKELSLKQVYKLNETEGCVYWQPKKLQEDHPSYKQILERIFEYS